MKNAVLPLKRNVFAEKNILFFWGEGNSRKTKMTSFSCWFLLHMSNQHSEQTVDVVLKF